MTAYANALEGKSRRLLFNENEPISTGFEPTGDGQEIYFEECGARNGKPCVILHGGPRRRDQSDHAAVLRSPSVEDAPLRPKRMWQIASKCDAREQYDLVVD